MARKHGTKPSRSKPQSKPLNKRESRVKRWETRDDIPQDDIDRFHNAKDKILLEGEDDGADEDDDDDEEVFALKGMAEESDSDEEEEADEDDAQIDGETVYAPAPSKASKKKGKKGKVSPPSSEGSGSDSESDEGWGAKKSEYYASNAAEVDSEDEEAQELEEQEAKRLQGKGRAELTEDDFGLGEAAEVDVDDGGIDILEDAPQPAAPVAEVTAADKESVLRQLSKTNPEALALARDWHDVAQSLAKGHTKIEALESADPDSVSLGMAHLHWQALQTYATYLAFYFHLRNSSTYAVSPDLLREHPIMQRLVQLKQSLATLEDLSLAPMDEDEDDFSGEDDEEDINDLQDAMSLWQMDRPQDMDADELGQLLEDAESILGEKVTLNGKVSKPKKAKPVSPDTPPKKKRKTTTTFAPLPVFDLVEPSFAPTSSSSSRPTSTPTADPSADPYGELTSLSTADAQDKASRKRTLRFHTSKIASSSARRGRAREGAAGGDDDIPWKDRRKGENNKVPEAKRGMGGEDLDDVREVAGAKRRREEEGEESGESDGEGYYELVKRTSKEAKEKKKAEHDAMAALQRIDPTSTTTSDGGPRSLTRAILANRGLTPHRSNKAARNPRVKKRQKFDKAKKKVASQKAVFKGGVAQTKGRYEGEKTGVSKVVKSVRL
ncbi:hypothetical protein EUX98_g7152 [Antrodiella citrinella]|uniref:Sas10 C-terminal domain-containing protein n=1 Tax=Antrodiella citrinella TaxID=2447956 RepID=A0A4S4MUM6_9APHY|nr:hypothetical protein EUX98_g7152 [Antrodiella citrinella]